MLFPTYVFLTRLYHILNSIAFCRNFVNQFSTVISFIPSLPDNKPFFSNFSSIRSALSLYAVFLSASSFFFGLSRDGAGSLKSSGRRLQVSLFYWETVLKLPISIRCEKFKYTMIIYAVGN